MVNTDNIISFPVPKPKTAFVGLVELVVYSARGCLITSGYYLDCKIELPSKNTSYVEFYLKQIGKSM
jgi:hypothetical protein